MYYLVLKPIGPYDQVELKGIFSSRLNASRSCSYPCYVVGPVALEEILA